MSKVQKAAVDAPAVVRGRIVEKTVQRLHGHRKVAPLNADKVPAGALRGDECRRNRALLCAERRSRALCELNAAHRRVLVRQPPHGRHDRLGHLPRDEAIELRAHKLIHDRHRGVIWLQNGAASPAERVKLHKQAAQILKGPLLKVERGTAHKDAKRAVWILSMHGVSARSGDRENL